MAARDELTQRLFVAIDLDDACRDLLADAGRRVADALAGGRAAARRRVRWVAGELLHVTVRFLGATPAATAEHLHAALAPGFTSAAFSLRFDRLGVFPETGRPRVVWAGPSHASDGAERMKRELEARLSALGCEPDARAFRPHVTLGRFRAPGHPRDAETVRAVGLEGARPMCVDHLTLYESHLSSAGPRYVALQRTSLDTEAAST